MIGKGHFVSDKSLRRSIFYRLLAVQIIQKKTRQL